MITALIFINIFLYLFVCWAVFGNLNLTTSLSKTILVVLIFSISTSNFSFFMGHFFKNKNLAYQISNLVILLPNLIVLVLSILNKNQILLSFINFLFPGSALLGIILQEKGNFLFTGKLLFMLFCSYFYLLAIFLYRSYLRIKRKVPI